MQQTLQAVQTEAETANSWPDLSDHAVPGGGHLPPLFEISTGDWSSVKQDPDIGRVLEPKGRRVKETIHDFPCDFAAVLGDPNAILEQYGRREIAFPKTYTGIEDWEPVMSKVTATSPRDGYGLSRYTLAGACRLTNGEGRISDETRVFEIDGGQHGFRYLAVGPRGTFVIEAVPIGSSMALVDEETYRECIDADDALTINGDLIPEEDEGCQRGIQKFITVFERYSDADLVGYGNYSGSHTLIDSNGDHVHLTGLSKLARMETDADALVGETSHTIESDREYAGDVVSAEVEPRDIKYEIGETTDSPFETDRYVVGYELNWREEEYIYSGGLNKVVLEISYVYFSEPDKYDYHDVDVRTTTDTVATINIDGETDN